MINTNLLLKLSRSTRMVALLMSLFYMQGSLAAPVDAVYAANSCKGLSQQAAAEGTVQFIWNGNEGMFGNTQGSNDVSRMVCPIVRQKIQTSNGAKFWAYFTGVIWNLGDRVSCTMTNRRPNTGALISTATSGNVNQASSSVTLTNSITPSSALGHYSLQCTINNLFNVMNSYRVREF
ncbi:MAG: hypothetical protein HKN85_05015 [Gammaproteobacteria bacterium]|nr:hypothetical protein [Gammaproteobacteria bacterium]